MFENGQQEIVAAEDIVWINGYPAPPAPPVRPMHAVASVLRLIQNKEDTRQVFEAVSAIAGDSGHKQFKRFSETDYGRRVIDEPVKLEDKLSDREWLRTLPEGSFGNAYLNFMEGEDLTPDGLLSSAKEAGIDFKAETQFPQYQRLFLHQSVMHDVFHVLTGYGRDALGELCNLAFTRQQTVNPGFRLIVAIGLIAQKAEAPREPLIRAVSEGAQMGRRSEFVLGYDPLELMPQPLEEVRRTLGIIEPKIYKSIPDELKYGLLKPKVELTQTQRETKQAEVSAACCCN